MPQWTGTGRCKADGRGNFIGHMTQHIGWISHRRQFAADSQCLDQAGEHLLPRAPEIRMTSKRRHLGRRGAGQPPGPVLRIGDDGPHLPKASGKAVF